MPRTFVNATTGILVEQLGWYHFFLLCAVLGVPGMLLLCIPLTVGALRPGRDPELMGWHLSGAVLIMIILGGIGHLGRRGDALRAEGDKPFYTITQQTTLAGGIVVQPGV